MRLKNYNKLSGIKSYTLRVISDQKISIYISDKNPLSDVTHRKFLTLFKNCIYLLFNSGGFFGVYFVLICEVSFSCSTSVLDSNGHFSNFLSMTEVALSTHPQTT